MVYVNDVIIFTKSFQEDLEHVNEVLGMLNKAELSLNMCRCMFFIKKLDYLGHAVSPR